MGDRARAAAARVAPREAGVGLDAAGYKLGLWYAAVQTSSVVAERCFGIMRNIEAPNKRSMRSPAWRAELYFRYNKWLVGRGAGPRTAPGRGGRRARRRERP